MLNSWKLALFPGQDLDLLRKEAAQTLLKAAEDGSLEAVLKKGTDQQDRRGR